MKTRRGAPTLGYQSKLHAAKALQDMGLSLTAIAKRMGMKNGGVSALLHHARKVNIDLANATIPVPGSVLDKLRPAAARRSMSAETLACLIIATCADHDLVNAVLDDEGEGA